KPERLGFRKWVRSPIANPREDVIQLTEFILSKRAVTANTMKREDAFAFVFPKKIYNEALLRYTMSYATQCLEDYLAYHNWKAYHANPAIVLTQTYNHRNLNTLASKQLENTQALLQQSSLKDSQHYMQTLSLEVEQYNLMSKNKRYEDFNLQKISDTVHHYVVAEILRYACIAQSFQQVSGKNTKFPLLESVLQFLEKGLYHNEPAIQIYYLLFYLSGNSDDDKFNNLYDLVFENENCFKEHELKDIFLLTINYCIKQLNTGKREYAKPAFTLYLHGLDKKYLLENGELSRFTFKNIAYIGIKHLKDYKQTELFISKYNRYVNESYRENSIQFTKAALFYAEKQFSKALRILQQVEFADVLWNVDAKILILKMLFELKEYESIPYQLKSLKMFIYRRKDIGYFKKIHKQTLTYFDLLYKNIHTGKQKRNQLKQLILSEKDLVEKEWFLNQV
ncbi:MAG: hypothetical protein JWN78_2649, partial [Bacteroidota bacterium]|nr:hypothetical protein [Bacteroidota bacterium]